MLASAKTGEMKFRNIDVLDVSDTVLRPRLLLERKFYGVWPKCGNLTLY